MKRSLQHIFMVCLLALGLLVQTTFTRADVVLCLGHLHPGSCMPVIDQAVEAEIGDDDCCDHAPAEIGSVLASAADSDQCQMPGCCCVDVQVSGQPSSASQRPQILAGAHDKSLPLSAPLGPCVPLRMMSAGAPRSSMPRASVPRNDLRKRAVILQI